MDMYDNLWICAACGQAITAAEDAAACERCGSVYHSSCWMRIGGCGCTAWDSGWNAPAVEPMQTPQPEMLTQPEKPARPERSVQPAIPLEPLEPALPVMPLSEEPAKTKSKAWIWLLLAGVATILAAVALVWVLVITPMLRYHEAEELMNEGDYFSAHDRFAELEDYSDSQEMARECYYLAASQLLEQGLYDGAQKYFEELGDYRDSADRAMQTRYARAEALADAGEFENAIAEFRALNGYGDSTDRMAEITYRWATDLQNKGEYMKAESLFASIPGYLDSKEMVKQNRYLRAFDSDYEESLRLFAELDDYTDSRQCLAERMIENLVSGYPEKPFFPAGLNLNDEQKTAVYLAFVNNVGAICNMADPNDACSFLEYLPQDYGLTSDLGMVFYDLANPDSNGNVIFSRYSLSCVWHLDGLRDYVIDNHRMEFLLGCWRSDNGLVLEFEYDRETGGIHLSRTLPSGIPAKGGSASYKIEANGEMWIKYNADWELDSTIDFCAPDQIDVNMEYNGRTYYLYRSQY